MYWIYNIPVLPLAAGFLVFFIGVSSIGVLVTRRWVHKQFIEEEGWREHVMVTLEGAFAFTGLLLALVAISAYDNLKTARESVAAEAAELGALYRSVAGYPQPIRGELEAELKDYVRYLIEVSWPQQAHGVVPVGGTLRTTVFQKKLQAYSPVTQGEIALHGATLFKFNDFAKARRVRLYSVTVALPAAMWGVLLASTLVNIALSCLLPVESVKAHLLLSGAFAAVIALLLFLTAAMDNPYRGSFSVSSEPFELVEQTIMGVDRHSSQ
jgi:hypothetical protein